MKIYLEELTFHRFNKKTSNFKVKKADICCKNMVDSLDKDLIIPIKFDSRIDVSSKTSPIEKSCFSYALNFELKENSIIPINFCPYCGQPINYFILQSTDCSEEVNALQKELKILLNKLRTYNNQDETLTNEVKKINDKLNYYYYIK